MPLQRMRSAHENSPMNSSKLSKVVRGSYYVLSRPSRWQSRERKRGESRCAGELDTDCTPYDDGRA